MLGSYLASLVMNRAIVLGIRNLLLAIVAGGFAIAGVVFLIMALYQWLETQTSPIVASLAIGGVLILIALIVVAIRAYTPAKLKPAAAVASALPSAMTLSSMASMAPTAMRLVGAVPAGLFGSFRRRPFRFLIGAIAVGALTEIVASRFKSND